MSVKGGEGTTKNLLFKKWFVIFVVCCTQIYLFLVWAFPGHRKAERLQNVAAVLSLRSLKLEADISKQKSVCIL